MKKTVSIQNEPAKKGVVRIAADVILCAVLIFAAYWFLLPPLNIRSVSMWWFVFLAAVICVVVNAFSAFAVFLYGIHSSRKIGQIGETAKKAGKPVKAVGILFLCFVVIGMVFSLIGAEIFHALAYNRLIVSEDGNFTADVAEISRSQIPVVDRDTASRLGQRKLGEIADLVSQFEIEEDYTQINYHGVPTRVTPLRYGDIIKWFNNQAQGIPAYITVDMTTQETALVRLEEGIRYSDSEILLRDLNRKLRFCYPTKIFDNISFEIDEDGTPWWVASCVTFRIGFWSGRDINGAVLLNAVTGESRYYDLADIPAWVDQIYDADMIMEQLTYNGKYRSGFWNSIFGQKGVLQPTDGYNYLAIHDDVYLYTGMTSVVSDESNVGFVLTNLRTKETRFYAIPGAEEYSAMGSAEGQVQHLNYVATFPLLLNISDRPTYFVSLKDAAGLVKMYAFVDVAQYQVVGTGSTVEAARDDYIAKLKEEDIAVDDLAQNTVSGAIAEITSAVISGDTHYFLTLADGGEIYEAPVTLSDRLPFAKAGDAVTLTFTESNGARTVTSIVFS